MNDLQTGVKELQLAVQTLLKAYANLKKENIQLKHLNDALRDNLLEKEKQVEDARQKLAAGHVNGFDADDRKLLQAKIDGYLKDIEKCLDLLNASPWKS